jgi:peptidoglycan/xylan/chitin deacetylase (PgdA/CDA1 family)
MPPTVIWKMASEGFLIGSHGIFHEDFGTLDPATADHVLRESRRLVGEIAGEIPDHFSFPKGHRGKNITPETFALAQQHYRYVYSAYGGYNLPRIDRRHFQRMGGPADGLELAMIMDGYTGFRECVAGNGWGVKTDGLPPY